MCAALLRRGSSSPPAHLQIHQTPCNGPMAPPRLPHVACHCLCCICHWAAIASGKALLDLGVPEKENYGREKKRKLHHVTCVAPLPMWMMNHICVEFPYGINCNSLSIANHMFCPDADYLGAPYQRCKARPRLYPQTTPGAPSPRRGSFSHVCFSPPRWPTCHHQHGSAPQALSSLAACIAKFPPRPVCDRAGWSRLPGVHTRRDITDWRKEASL